jgi:hypothetical protein
VAERLSTVPDRRRFVNQFVWGGQPFSPPLSCVRRESTRSAATGFAAIDESRRGRALPAGTMAFRSIGECGYAGDMPGHGEQSPASSILTGTSRSPERSDDDGSAGAGVSLTGTRHREPIQATASALDPTCTRAPVCRCSMTILAARPRPPRRMTKEWYCLATAPSSHRAIRAISPTTTA